MVRGRWPRGESPPEPRGRNAREYALDDDRAHRPNGPDRRQPPPLTARRREDPPMAYERAERRERVEDGEIPRGRAYQRRSPEERARRYTRSRSPKRQERAQREVYMDDDRYPGRSTPPRAQPAIQAPRPLHVRQESPQDAGGRRRRFQEDPCLLRPRSKWELKDEDELARSATGRTPPTRWIPPDEPLQLERTRPTSARRYIPEERPSLHQKQRPQRRHDSLEDDAEEPDRAAPQLRRTIRQRSRSPPRRQVVQIDDHRAEGPGRMRYAGPGGQGHRNREALFEGFQGRGTGRGDFQQQTQLRGQGRGRGRFNSYDRDVPWDRRRSPTRRGPPSPGGGGKWSHDLFEEINKSPGPGAEEAV